MTDLSDGYPSVSPAAANLKEVIMAEQPEQLHPKKTWCWKRCRPKSV